MVEIATRVVPVFGLAHGLCNRTVASDQEKANLLNDYFASVGVIDDGKPLDVSPTTSRGTKLDSIAFTPDKLRKVMCKIKGNSSPGPDGYPPVLLKNLSHSLAQPLSVMFASLPRQYCRLHIGVTQVRC